MAEGAEYQFVSCVRTGIGAMLDGAAATVRLHVTGASDVPKSVAPYGPGDVTALDARAIVRTVPRAGVMDFEPNLFPSVELAHPGLPWMLSARGDLNGRVTPWIVLVVVEEQAGVTITTGANSVLTIDAPASPARELPDLTQAWAWAHGQTTGTAAAPIDTVSLARSSGEARGRLLAPRKLEPGKTYVACIVPAFAAGVAAALGRGSGDGLAWTRAESTVRLPVYFSWRFGTGPGGDFASLVKLLEPEKLGAEIGHRAIDVSAPGWGVDPIPDTTIELSGALRSTAWTPPDLPTAVTAMGDQIAAEIDAAGDPGRSPPVFGPPFYGATATKQQQTATAPTWQRNLNHDLRERAAAGLGAAVVRGNLDDLADAAWRAAGDAEHANELLRTAELAAEVTSGLARRHVRAIDDDGEAISIARPLLARMHAHDDAGARGARMRAPVFAPAGPTVASAVRSSAMPNAALSPSLRRLGRPGGPVARTIAAPLDTGAVLAKVDAKQIVPVPLKSLADGAAGFDEVSKDEHERPRFRAATEDAISEAQAHWKGAARVARARAAPVTAARRRTDVPDGEGDWTPEPISETPDPDPVAIDEFAAAARAHQRYILGRLEKIQDHGPPPLGNPTVARPLAALRATVESQWDADRGIVPIVGSRIGGVDPGAIESFQPVRIPTVLDEPLVRSLQALSPEHVLPGIGTLGSNRAGLADTAPEFVRAFLVGANDELGRELLWRGFPGALGHTWLQTFWGRTVLDGGKPTPVPDIAPIEGWPDAGATPSPASLVLVVRADVLHRYPNAIVYALEAKWKGSHRVLGDGAPVSPVIAATLGTDVALFGFDLTDAAARGTDAPSGAPGWYFVIAEHPSEPKFGLAASSTAMPTAWKDVAWSDVADADLAGAYLRTDGPLATRQLTGDPARWGVDAASLAAITRRRLARVAMHASTLMV